MSEYKDGKGCGLKMYSEKSAAKWEGPVMGPNWAKEVNKKGYFNDQSGQKGKKTTK